MISFPLCSLLLLFLLHKFEDTPPVEWSWLRAFSAAMMSSTLLQPQQRLNHTSRDRLLLVWQLVFTMKAAAPSSRKAQTKRSGILFLLTLIVRLSLHLTACIVLPLI